MFMQIQTFINAIKGVEARWKVDSPPKCYNVSLFQILCIFLYSMCTMYFLTKSNFSRMHPQSINKLCGRYFV